MKHTHDVLRDRLHKRAGLHEPPAPKYNLAELFRTEWSPEFEQLMRNRLVMGAFRYGLLADKKLKGKKWDLIDPIRKKVELYEANGNAEYLVDAANYCLLAFECDNHPYKHFRALDDHHDHCKRRRGESRIGNKEILLNKLCEAGRKLRENSGKAIGQIFNGAKPYTARELNRSGKKWRKAFRNETH